MAGYKVTVLIFFIGMVMYDLVCSQTFQYSRGWTNGKRSYRSEQGLENSAREVLESGSWKEPLVGRPIAIPEAGFETLIPRVPIRRTRSGRANSINSIENRLNSLEQQLQKWFNPESTQSNPTQVK